MNKKEIDRLEKKFDRELSEGEAAEIKNTDVIHMDDERLYEDRDELTAPFVINGITRNGR